MILDLGLVDYEESYALQKELVGKVRSGQIEDSAIIAEHRAVFTIGRTGKKENLLAGEEALRDADIKFLNVDRGGDITFHGPGQIVLYPVIDLKNRGRDLHRYLRDLEGLAMSFLKDYSVSGDRVEGRTGVWVGDKKIAFIGIAATDWITYHGLSVNINVDLKYFSMIRPCGLEGVEIVSLNEILNRDIDMAEAKERLIQRFSNIFQAGERDYADNFSLVA
ncbi:MAG: lipoyl(octanoyl) transferase LipB [Candidatus Omnitrophica bacterium]|nr:lipoyl(octanoyl) transferase LipB [Candidatus Omnitrophota bacterium]